MDRLEQAFNIYRRMDFMPDNIGHLADLDIALPIGFGQTSSQPTVVHDMLDWLAVEPGDNVLDIGSGSGWTTAMLAYLTGPKGLVYAVERLPKLLRMGRRNCENAGITNAKFYLAKSQLGLPKYAPYKRILVSAAATQLPDKLLEQLKIGGKLVIPVNENIQEITKTSSGSYKTITHSGYVFVPLL